MQKLILYIFSNHKDFAIEIDNNSKEAELRYIELISIFWNITAKGIELVPIIQMNDEIRTKYNTFVKKYTKEVPRLNRLKSSLDQIKNDEFFFTSNKSSHTPKEILFIGNLIDVHNTTNDDKERAKLFQKKLETQDDFFDNLLAKYNIKVFDTSSKISIGEPNRKNRICRFCKMGEKDGKKFKKKAHAFSEALGNKTIVLNEECDDCNEKFGSNIEKDFIQYLDVYRVFFKVKGKNSIPKLKFNNNAVVSNVEKKDIPENNLEILDDTENLMVVVSQNIEHNKETGDLTVLLESNNKLKEVNIYKTLCKYALSVIDSNELQHFEKTIDWINTNNEQEINLPKIAHLIANHMYVDIPMLSLYIRKNNDYTHPYVVAEFKFKSLIFVYILPFSSKDMQNFIENEKYNLFWKTFKHYDSVKDWVFNDFSDTKEKKYQFRMRMVNNNTNKTE
jgi:hypothetical protein